MILMMLELIAPTTGQSTQAVNGDGSGHKDKPTDYG